MIFRLSKYVYQLSAFSYNWLVPIASSEIPQTRAISTHSRHGALFSFAQLRVASLIVVIVLAVTTCFTKVTHAGCHVVQTPTTVHAGLHLKHDRHAVGQKPIAEGIWWYSGPVDVVYEAGGLKYFPILDDVDCRGPGCKRKQPSPSLEVVATNNGRSVDVGNCPTRSRRSNRSTTSTLSRIAFAFYSDPTLAGLLRPPCAAS